MNIIIAGSRSFTDYGKLWYEVEKILEELVVQSMGNLEKDDIVIISGNAKGADELGKRYAKERKFKLKIMPANWNDMSEPCARKINDYGKPYNALAGMKRNRQMADIGDILILFWNGSSPGSKNMLEVAKEKNLVIYDIRV